MLSVCTHAGAGCATRSHVKCLTRNQGAVPCSLHCTHSAEPCCQCTRHRRQPHALLADARGNCNTLLVTALTTTCSRRACMQFSTFLHIDQLAAMSLRSETGLNVLSTSSCSHGTGASNSGMHRRCSWPPPPCALTAGSSTLGWGTCSAMGFVPAPQLLRGRRWKMQCALLNRRML